MRSRFYVYLLGLVLFCLLPLSNVVPAQLTLPAWDDLEPGMWHRLDPGGETTCAARTPYAFFARPVEESDKLMLYFQGGGACWNSFMCNIAGGTATFDSTVSEDEVHPNGIFDFENPANPIADYNIVFLPYCTGDVFTGSQTVEYSETVTVEHQGYTNTRVVLDWVYENFENPTQVFVTGSSAGSLGAIFHAADIMKQYADTPVIQLGDGLVGLFTERGAEDTAVWGLTENMAEALREADGLPADEFTSGLYIATARAFPDNIVAQFTTAADNTQVLFYTLMGGTQADALAGIPDSLMLIEEAVPNFRSYLAAGDLHTILARPEFYTLETNGITMRDWLAGLLEGEAVGNVAP